MEADRKVPNLEPSITSRWRTRPVLRDCRADKGRWSECTHVHWSNEPHCSICLRADERTRNGWMEVSLPFSLSLSLVLFFFLSLAVSLSLSWVAACFLFVIIRKRPGNNCLTQFNKSIYSNKAGSYDMPFHSWRVLFWIIKPCQTHSYKHTLPTHAFSISTDGVWLY